MLNKENREKCGKIIKIYPREQQLQIAQEECAELIQAISKYLRYGDIDPLLEEFADVHIVLEQIRQMFGITEDEANRVAEIKLYRALEGRVVVNGRKTDS